MSCCLLNTGDAGVKINAPPIYCLGRNLVELLSIDVLFCPLTYRESSTGCSGCCTEPVCEVDVSRLRGAGEDVAALPVIGGDDVG